MLAYNAKYTTNILFVTACWVLGLFDRLQQASQGDSAAADAACRRLQAQVKELSESRDHSQRAHVAIEKQVR